MVLKDLRDWLGVWVQGLYPYYVEKMQSAGSGWGRVASRMIRAWG